MSFLFGKKDKDKHKEQSHGRSVPPSRDGHTAPGPGSLASNGVKPKHGATGPTPIQSPGSSVNHSITNSINGVGGKTPSPDQGREKDGQGGEGGGEMQVCHCDRIRLEETHKERCLDEVGQVHGYATES